MAWSIALSFFPSVGLGGPMHYLLFSGFLAGYIVWMGMQNRRLFSMVRVGAVVAAVVMLQWHAIERGFEI